MTSRSAVLVLAFNRPDKTARLLEAIVQMYNPSRLYLAVDGPRAGRPEEQLAVQKVQALAETLRSKTELRTLFRETNLGCQKAVSGAVSWFFSYEEEGIILEDDITPSSGFFAYCDWALNEYRDRNDIYHVGGFQCGNESSTDHSVYLNTFPHVWGWATWKRAWSAYDPGVVLVSRRLRKTWIESAVKAPETRSFYDRVFVMTAQGKLDSWAMRWVLSVWKNNGLAVSPPQSLVANTGIGIDSTHTRFESHLASTAIGEFDQTRSCADVRFDIARSENFHRFFHRADSASKRFRMLITTMLPNSWFRYFRKLRG